MSITSRLATDRLGLRAIHGNLTVTRAATTAWFKLPASSWAFRGDDDRAAELHTTTAAYAKLADKELHLRVTTRPYPVSTWAANLAAHGPQPPVPGDGQGRWFASRRRLYDAWCDRQNAVQAHLNNSRLDSKETYLGVVLDRSQTGSEALNKLSGQASGRAEAKRLAGTRNQVEGVMTGPGMNARPATSHELEWLVHRSVAPHIPAPEFLEALLHDQPVTQVAPYLGLDTPGLVPEADMGQFTDWLTVESAPRSKTAAVTAQRDGYVHTRRVAALAVGNVDEGLTIPPEDPWLAELEKLPFPVEVSARLRVLPGPDVAKGIERKLKFAQNQQEHHAEHGLHVPKRLQRQVELAADAEDEVTSGSETAATRVHGTVHLSVGSLDEETTLDRARAVVDLYRQRQVRMHHLPAQAAHLRAFAPGEDEVSGAHTRRMPATMWAASGPTVTATLGDGIGPYLGETTRSSRRPVFWDPFVTILNENPGLAAVVAKLGGGKSTLIGSIVYQAVLRGIPATLLDPAPPPVNLGALTTMPELVDHAALVNLMEAPAGTLNPFALVPDPDLAVVDNRAAFDEEMRRAASDRMLLARDIIQMLLPPRDRPEAEGAVRAAVRQVGGGADASLDQVVDALAGMPDNRANSAAAAVSDIAGLSMSRLFFGRPEQGGVSGTDALLTVITMPGLSLPPDNPEVEPSQEELLAVPLLHLASRLATRRAFNKPQARPAILGLDEMHFLTRWGSGRTLFQRVAHDSRRNRLRVFASAKKPSELLDMDVAALISEAFVGKIEDHDTARDALRLLRVPTDVGYEQAIASLSGQGQRASREFIMRDGSGTVDRLRVDLDHNPDLITALSTGRAPTRTPATSSSVPAAAGNPSRPEARPEARPHRYGGRARMPAEPVAHHPPPEPGYQQKEEPEWWQQ